MVPHKKLVIITDAWYPQVNGVVTTYSNLIQHIDNDVYDVEIIEPSQFSNINWPFYKEIKLSFCSVNKMKNIIKSLGQVWRFHIATEGPLGLCAKLALEDMKYKYTTAYHTKFPEYLESSYFIPKRFTQKYINWFHSKSRIVFVPSQSVADENPHWNTEILGKGFDKSYFKPRDYDTDWAKSDEKVLLYVGRVSKEKNIEDFCKLYLPHTKKVVVGNGPHKKALKKKYPDVQFVGYKFGSDLSYYYRSADVFVFPSRTDTFGIVILEAMACGTPVAAYPVTGCIDQIVNGVNGFTGFSLSNSVLKCFSLNRNTVTSSVTNYSWAKAANEFLRAIT